MNVLSTMVDVPKNARTCPAHFAAIVPLASFSTCQLTHVAVNKGAKIFSSIPQYFGHFFFYNSKTVQVQNMALIAKENVKWVRTHSNVIE